MSACIIEQKIGMTYSILQTSQVLAGDWTECIELPPWSRRRWPTPTPFVPGHFLFSLSSFSPILSRSGFFKLEVI